jgi:hypothetical protein
MEFVILSRSYQVLEMQIFRQNANFQLLFGTLIMSAHKNGERKGY